MKKPSTAAEGLSLIVLLEPEILLIEKELVSHQLDFIASSKGSNSSSWRGGYGED